MALGQEQEKGLRVKGNLKSLGNYNILCGGFCSHPSMWNEESLSSTV